MVELSGKGIILLLGGIFLIYKSTTEIHHKITGDKDEFDADKTKDKNILYRSIISNSLIRFSLFIRLHTYRSGHRKRNYRNDCCCYHINARNDAILHKPVSRIVNKYPITNFGFIFLILIGVTPIMEGLEEKWKSIYLCICSLLLHCRTIKHPFREK